MVRFKYFFFFFFFFFVFASHIFGQIQVISSGETRLVTLEDTVKVDSLLGVNINGVIKSVPLSGLSIGTGTGTSTGTDDQTLTINGSNLEIEDGNSVDLSGTGAIRYHTGSYVGMTSGPSSNGSAGGSSPWRRNNLIGDNAGQSTTTGYWNNFLGFNAGASTTVGHRNNYFGARAGQFDTSGYMNNYFGFEAGRNATGSAVNNYFGAYAGRSSNGSHNNYFGYLTGEQSSGVYNTFIGSYAGRQDTADNVIGIGRNAGQRNTGRFSSFIGTYAGQNNTGRITIFLGLYAGRNNTANFTNAMGYQAGMNNSGFGSNLIGYRAGRDNTGLRLNAIGWDAGIVNSGTNNVFIGTSAGIANTDGSSNVYIGQNSGNSTTGSNNVAIGNGANLFSPTASNQINIGNAIYKLSDNRIGLFTTNPQYSFDVNGNGHFSGAFFDSGGNSGSNGDVLMSTGATTTWIPFSTLCDSCSNNSTGGTHTGTEGSIFFAGADNLPSEDNENLYWDQSHQWLGIGRNSEDPNVENRASLNISGPSWNFQSRKNLVSSISVKNQTTINGIHRGILNMLFHHDASGIYANIGLHNHVSGHANAMNTGIFNYMYVTSNTDSLRTVTGLVNAFSSTEINGNVDGVTNNLSGSIRGNRIIGFHNYSKLSSVDPAIAESVKIYGLKNDFVTRSNQKGAVYGVFNHITVDTTYVNDGDVFGTYTYIEDDDSSGDHYGLYIDVQGDSAYAEAAFFNGNVTITNGIWNGSDKKLKEEIKPFEMGLNLLSELNVKSFYLKADKVSVQSTKERRRHYGLIAQDVRKVAPNLVRKVTSINTAEVKDKSISYLNGEVEAKMIDREFDYKKEDLLAVNYLELIPVLIKAVQEQQDKIKELEERIKKLEDK